MSPLAHHSTFYTPAEKEWRSRTITISAEEVKEISDAIQGPTRQETLTTLKREDALARHIASKERIQHWDQTVTGIRRKRLIARDERLKQEEEVRLEQDREFAQDKVARRKACLDRARELQYFAKDVVQGIHSKVLLYRVLEERDLQLQKKQEINFKKADMKVRSLREMEAQLQEANELEEKKQLGIKEVNAKFARDQAEQRQEKLNKKLAEKEVKLKEGKRVMELDREYLIEAKRKEEVRRIKEVQIDKELVEMNKNIKEFKLVSKKADAILIEKVKKWQAQKDHQLELKKEIEKKRLNEKLNIGVQLAAKQIDLEAIEYNDMLARIEKQVKFKEEKADKAEKEKQEKIEQQHIELKDAYFALLKNKAKQAEMQKEKSKEELAELLQIQREHTASIKAKKIENRKKGIVAQTAILDQMTENKGKKLQQKMDRVQYGLERKKRQTEEEKALAEYIKKMSKEAWAIPNARLQGYLVKTAGELELLATLPKKAGVVSLSAPHLGLEYLPLDTIRSNPIVTGRQAV